MNLSNPTAYSPQSCFADAATARQAIEMALPMIEPAIADRRICGGGFLAIVVLDPARSPQDSRFDEAVLHEHALGDQRAWGADYTAFARAKARLSWQHRLDTHLIQTCRPHVLTEGDSLLGGGVWLDGITVGVSGAEAWYDIAFATAIAANLRALAAHRHADALKAGATAASPLSAARTGARPGA